jgi:hypothetical protein
MQQTLTARMEITQLFTKGTELNMGLTHSPLSMPSCESIETGKDDHLNDADELKVIHAYRYVGGHNTDSLRFAFVSNDLKH